MLITIFKKFRARRFDINKLVLKSDEWTNRFVLKSDEWTNRFVLKSDARINEFLWKYDAWINESLKKLEIASSPEKVAEIMSSYKRENPLFRFQISDIRKFKEFVQDNPDEFSELFKQIMEQSPEFICELFNNTGGVIE